MSLIPDVETVAVEWAKNNAALQVLIGAAPDQRVATRLPKSLVFPFLRVVRIPPGTRDSGESEIDHANLQWDAYGKREKGGPDYVGASGVARTLVEELEKAKGVVGSAGYIMGARIIAGPYRVEEPETEWARFLVESVMSVRRI
jgi:hypothetical protein